MSLLSLQKTERESERRERVREREREEVLLLLVLMGSVITARASESSRLQSSRSVASWQRIRREK